MNILKSIMESLGIIGKVAEAKIGLKVAKIDAQAQATLKVLDTDSGWEHMAAQNASNSPMDEWWTGLLSVPLILAFVGFGGVVEQGFEALADVPQWYTWAVLASVSFAFARKKLPPLSSWVKRK